MNKPTDADGARVHSFAPIESVEARVLIVGSMPGRASLDAGAYYAHPRNDFWPILASLLAFDAAADYAVRVEALRRRGVGVWDVLQSCERAGSLDAAIVPGSVVINDFADWFRRHPQTRAVLCNGGTALRSFQRWVQPTLPASLAGLKVHSLPSTSPAHAAMRFAEKRRAWSVLLDYLV